MKNSWILITGVSTGIGHALAAHYLGKGHRVIGTVRKMQDATDLDALDGFYKILYDVSDAGTLPRFKAEVETLVGTSGLFALINNAGIAIAGPMECLPDGEFEYLMNVNVLSVRRITNAFLPMMGEGSRIVNMSSVSGLFNSPYTGAYCISKHALESMTDVYRRELMAFGIRVIAIEPGPIATKIWGKSKGTLNRFLDTRYGATLKNADRIIENAERTAFPVEEIVRVCEKALFDPDPATRYLIHRKKLLFRLVSGWLPDKLVDRLVAKTMKGGKKHRMV
ncbi:MAG: SDR family NAD(P)-dependent oxidoreductase [Saprospiraceae bacterium]|nr:SDR family NAD(P)-dependent oxidoreductase [Saprospiraceae bacterium]